MELRWSVFPLHPETPDQGMKLTDLFPDRANEIEAMQERLVQLAASEGLTLTKRTHTYNSRLAQELGKWAETKDKFEAYRPAVYRAYFVKGRNIAQIDELVKIIESIGLSGDEARQVLENGSFATAVDTDWQRARELGVTAVPTHIFDHDRLVGFSPYDDFLSLIGKR